LGSFGLRRFLRLQRGDGLLGLCVRTCVGISSASGMGDSEDVSKEIRDGFGPALRKRKSVLGASMF